MTRRRELSCRVQMRPHWRRELEVLATHVEHRSHAEPWARAVALRELDRDIYAETVVAVGYDPLSAEHWWA
jgi:hypothetical protein